MQIPSLCVCVCVCVCAHSVHQLCPTLCDPMDYNLPGSSVHGIFQARRWVTCNFLLQGIFPTQGSNPSLWHLLHRQEGSLPLLPPGKPSPALYHLGKFILFSHLSICYSVWPLRNWLSLSWNLEIKIASFLELTGWWANSRGNHTAASLAFNNAVCWA